MDQKRDAIDSNAVSADFQRVFDLGLNDYNRAFMQFVTADKMLPPGGSVLDIGCGVGKYGALFAELGHPVTLTDISRSMLDYAEKNMAKFSTPWRSMVCDFDKATGDEPVFRDGFDLVISTFSPAVHDLNTVRKMSAMSRGWCVAAKFVSWEQPFRDALAKHLGRDNFETPAEDPSELVRCVNAAGYPVHSRTVPYNWSDRRTPEEMADYLLRGRLSAISGRDALRADIIKYCTGHMSADGTVTDAVKTQVIWLYWNTKESGPLKAQFDEAAAFHGHRCPGLAMGVRAGCEALRALGVEKNEHKLHCTAESSACYLDGIQITAGTTMGKRAIEIVDKGLAAFTFSDSDTGAKVRLCYRASLPEAWDKEAKINYILTAPVEQVYEIEKFSL